MLLEYGADLTAKNKEDKTPLDLIEDFRLSENDRIGLQSGIGYELHQQGDDLQLISSLGVTTLLNVDLGGFSAIDHIVAL